MYQHRGMGAIGGNLCLEPRCQNYNQSYFLRGSLSNCLKAGGDKCLAVNGRKCYAVYSGDTAPALLAMGAKVQIGSADGERWIDLAQLYSGQGLNPLKLSEKEALLRIFIGKEAARSGGAYLKLADRAAIDFPSLGAAVSVRMNGNRIARLGIALTAAGSAPFLLEEAESLAGTELRDDNLPDAVLDEAAKRSIFLKNTAVSAPYRRAMARRMIRAAFEMASARANGQDGGCRCEQ
jgi:4-hydroxybenzoyl-CoA reductase subunit beta